MTFDFSAQNKKANREVGFLCLAFFYPWPPTTLGLGPALSSKGLWWVVLGSNQ
ncbi:hypothetical protein [Achromobacter anxifer]|uniref:hypothetical protein n=1 Tax=Achromobacter anxifer TaxID=1287737 RepID=UPI00158208A3|nr:hypothetical protein [Achromobacter anxifer]MDF8360252.1 hypothetical protein [Achromobacter anxifer]